MMASEFIINVTESDFEYEVLSYSMNKPVIVDFWATWCIPCKVLSPILEDLAQEAQGAFRLAKVNIDESPNLAKVYRVMTIPTVKAFKQGQVVSEFSGSLPVLKVKEFLRDVIPNPVDLVLEKGNSLFNLRQWTSAETTFREILAENHDLPAGLLGLAKCHLAQGRGREGLSILSNFPASKEFTIAEILMPLAEAMVNLENNQLTVDDPLSAAFRNCIRLASRGNVPAALDGLMDILRQNKKFLNGKIRLVILALLEILGPEDPQTREYRSELASILF